MMRNLRRSVSPVLVLGLTALWMLLNQTLSPGQLVLGVALSLLLAWAGSTLRPLQAQLQRIDVAAALLLVVLADITRSNIEVARIVLGLTGRRRIRSAFLDIPLELRDPHGLAVLAAIITSTPGTVWAGLSGDGRKLRLHVLDLADEAHWIRLIKGRYERRLMRIFE
ncbi:MAG: Na+/H+ antiporter subunit E [Gammaproteobacteria bacterium]|nr:Na+/H+ antiporter subunit E [Gammaproteobacteria bacterium]